MRYGRQTPTASVVRSHSGTKGKEAIELYEETGRKAQEWQKNLLEDIMATGEDGLWAHMKFGYSVPRRNGKNEIIAMRELYGLATGETICHTAHRTSTSNAAWRRLLKLLAEAGYEELGRRKKDEDPPEKSYRTTRNYGLEAITLTSGGTIYFRTRTKSGGLGEGFDLLIIDEAQEYTDDQETALIYTVTDSPNPQTILCGTPPTAISAGTVFMKMRDDILAGQSDSDGWAEWSLPEQTQDVRNVDLWYETNPAMGTHLDERKIRSELKKDTIDFNIQRLGVWLKYNQKSAITREEWDALTASPSTPLKKPRYFGIKYGVDGANVAVSVASRTEDGRIFVEGIDCRPIRDGNEWLLPYLQNPNAHKIVIDGKGERDILADAMKERKMKPPVLPSTGEIIVANAMFEQGIYSGSFCHPVQASMAQIASNCEKRPIGNSGGFGYRSLKAGAEIALLDSTMLAYWLCATSKEPKKQRISY